MQEAHVHEPFATVDSHLNSMFVLTCMLSVIRKANDPDFCLRSYLVRSARTLKHKIGILLLPLFAVLAIAAGTVLLVSLAQSVKLSLEKGETQSATHNRNKRQVVHPLSRSDQ